MNIESRENMKVIFIGKGTLTEIIEQIKDRIKEEK